MWLKDVCHFCRHRSDTGQLERRLWAEAVEEVEAKPRARDSGFFMLQICVSIVPQKGCMIGCVLWVMRVFLHLSQYARNSFCRILHPSLCSCTSFGQDMRGFILILDHFCWHTSLDIALAFSYFPGKYAASTQDTSMQLRIFISIPSPRHLLLHCYRRHSNKTFLKAQGTVKSQRTPPGR